MVASALGFASQAAKAASSGAVRQFSPFPVWVLLGAPGSGKGTYAKILASRLRLVHVSVGDLARRIFREEPERFAALQQRSEEGGMLPDDLVVDLLGQHLSKLQTGVADRGAEAPTHDAVLLDGFPRTVVQARRLDSLAPPIVALNVSIADCHVLSKMDGRRLCVSCGASYNIADVHDAEDDVYMPAMLPLRWRGDVVGASAAADNGSLRCDCGGLIVRRKDDVSPGVAAQRLRAHHNAAAEMLDFYRDKGVLEDYRVRYGLGDMDELVARLTAYCGASGVVSS
eukprot:TRINITY_DN52533_c0_g1_i1.p1 TRINITY_DN52533_c0_g1~~TRINITY_DN52533_c0_g1_i1.p1  ORF type:complete len:284 (-),score=56.78 TRINITY_DN52533_c0_g1_i1:72-923(-)